MPSNNETDTFFAQMPVATVPQPGLKVGWSPQAALLAAGNDGRFSSGGGDGALAGAPAAQAVGPPAGALGGGPRQVPAGSGRSQEHSAAPRLRSLRRRTGEKHP